MYTHILRMNGERLNALHVTKIAETKRQREESEKKERIREIGDGARLLLAAV